MKIKFYFLLLIIITLSGCGGFTNQGEITSSKNFGKNTFIPTIKPLIESQEGIEKESIEESHNEDDPMQLNEDQLQWQGPGEVFVPILLYHHILNHEAENIYTVTVTDFRKQMNYLIENGFTSITTKELVNAILEGGNLPQKPVIITFDDGNENIYLHAFPIMEELGLTGTLYLISNRLTASGFLSVDKLNEMIIKGWEVGSHGNTHVDLVAQPDTLRTEIGDSKKKLEESLNTEIASFAYPYGKANSLTKDWVKRIGYSSAMGLGISNFHNENEIWYLSRRQVDSNTTLVDFIQLLSHN